RRVAIAVGDVDLPVRRHRHVGGMVEGRLQRRPAALAERKGDPPLRRELEDLVLVTVADVDVVVGADVDPVRVAQPAAAPGGEEVAVAVEHEDGGVLALVKVDAVPRVHGHVADESEGPAGGQDAPRAEDIVEEVAGAHDEAGGVVSVHVLSPLRVAGSLARVGQSVSWPVKSPRIASRYARRPAMVAMAEAAPPWPPSGAGRRDRSGGADVRSEPAWWPPVRGSQARAGRPQSRAVARAAPWLNARSFAQ